MDATDVLCGCFLGPDTTENPEDRSRVPETGSSSDYSSLNMTSINANVVYDALQQTQTVTVLVVDGVNDQVLFC